MDSASASTTLVSDTTETDTDSGDTTPYLHPNCPEQQEKTNVTIVNQMYHADKTVYICLIH